MKRPTLRERLLSKAVINWDTGCWEWTACKSASGYGKFSVGGQPQPAHRVAYELIEGPVPEGLVLDHLCRNRGCINPAHLEPVTDRENILRGEGPSADAARQTHCAASHPFDEANTRTTRDRACRACDKERQAAYYQAKREEKLAYAAAYREKNRELLRTKHAAYKARLRAATQAKAVEP